MIENRQSTIDALSARLERNGKSLAFARLADCYLQEDKIDEAIRICEQGLLQNPEYVNGHFVLGLAYLGKKQYDQAKHEFSRTLHLDPQHIGAHRQMAELMDRIGWQEDRLASCKAILRIDPLDEVNRGLVEDLERELKEGQDTTVAHGQNTEVQPPHAPPAVSSSVDELSGEAARDDLTVDESSYWDEIFPESEAFAAASLEPKVDDVAEPEVPDFADIGSGGEELPTLDSDESLAPAPDPASSEEEHYSKILDDIFQEEIMDREEEGEGEIFDERELDKLLATSSEEEPEASGTTREAGTFSGGTPLDAGSIVEDMSYSASDFDSFFEPEPAKPEQVGSERTASAPDSPEVLDFPAADGAGNGPGSLADFGHQSQPPEKRPPAEEVMLQYGEQPARPQPMVEAPPRPKPAPATAEQDTGVDVSQDVSQKENIVTTTLAQIYIAQKQYRKAINVYEILLKKDPGNEFYSQEIERLNQAIEEERNAG